MSPTPTLTYVDVPIFNQLLPKEGPKAIQATFDFTVATSYEIDLQNLQSRMYIREIQTIFIDNSKCTGSFSVATSNTYQTVTIPAGYQAYIPVLMPNPPRFVFTGSGGTAKIQLLNVPMPCGVWPAASGGVEKFDANGNLLVVDNTLINALSTIQNPQYADINAGTTVPIELANKRGGIYTSDTSNHTLITGNPSYCLKGFEIFLEGNVAAAAAGNYAISLADSSGKVLTVAHFYLPATAGTGMGGQLISSHDNLDFFGGASGSTLYAVSNVAFTSGGFNVNVYYTLSNTIDP